MSQKPSLHQDEHQTAQNRFETLAALTQAVVRDWDMQTNRFWWSERLQTQFGHSGDQLVQAPESWLALIHPEDQELIRQQLTSLLDGSGQDWRVRYRLRRAGGEYVAVEETGRLLRERGRAIRLLVTMQPVENEPVVPSVSPEPVQLEADVLRQLQHSEELLRSTEQVAMTGSYEADLKTMRFRFSEGLFRLFGEEPYAFEPSLELIDARSHPEDVPVIRNILNDAAATGKPYVYQRRVFLPSGDLRTLEANGQVVCDREGKAIKFIGLVQDITERKRAGEVLRESKELLQSVFDASPISTAVFNIIRNPLGQAEDFEVVLFNDFTLQTLGKSADEVTGRRYAELYPIVVTTGLLDRFRQVADTGEAADFERSFVAPDQVHWFRFVVTRLNNLLVVNTESITRRKNDEAEIAKHLTVLRQSEKLAFMGSWEYETATGQLTWSEGMYRLFELPGDAPVQPELYLEFAAPEDLPIAQRIVENVVVRQESFETTLRIQVGSQQRTMRIRALALPGGPDQPAKVLGVNWDISSLLETQKRLQETADELQAVLDTSPGFVAFMKGVHDADHPDNIRDFTLTVGNDQLSRYLGKPLNQLLGQSVRQLSGVLWNEATVDLLKRVYHSETPINEEKHWTDEAGKHWMAITVSRQDDGVMVTGIDISSLKQAQSGQQFWLEQLEEAGESAHLLADLRHTLRHRGKLLRAVSHDLRGHVGIINSAAQLLGLTENEAERTHMIQMILGNVRQLTQLMTNLLDYARLEAGQQTRTLGTFDAFELLSDLGEAVLPLARQQALTLLISGPSSLPVEGDRVNVSRIAQNLLLNALKYTPSGTVTLSWGENPEERRWWFRVSDTGPGLSARVVDFLWHELSSDTEGAGNEPDGAGQAITLGQGEGIGLRIVQELVKLLEARLEVSSEAGIGTEFRVSFPLAYGENSEMEGEKLT